MTTAEPCLFCRFASGEITPDIVGESELALAFRDINPVAPTHVLVIPKRHVPTVGELAAFPEDLAEVAALAASVAAIEGLGDGYRLVFNTGPAAGQTVFHTHGHLLGGRDLTWPPG